MLDTHTLLWSAQGNTIELSPTVQTILTAPQTQVVVSIVTVWEMAIKISINKLPLFLPFEDFIQGYIVNTTTELLPVLPRHAVAVSSLPFHHRDPFDRLLIAQSITEKLPIISRDNTFDAYGVERVW
jgi:PIN domain nuclease of toxin-antitoxin system